MNQNKSRSGKGKKAGLTGLLANLILSAAKITAGILFSSVSVVTDGLNNLSDAAASLITLAGFYFSEKPADRDHPYGHARFEYLSALSVSFLILLIGVESGKSALSKIFHPESIVFSPLLIGVLAVSLITKLFLMLYYRFVGKEIHSPALLAAEVDSRNDTILTSAVLAGALSEHFLSLFIDGYLSIAISLFILYGGIRMAKETISPLLGEGGDETLKRKVEEAILAHPVVKGCHDLLIHDYGPERRYATIHVETDKDLDPLECHEYLDSLERKCLEEFGVHLVIHHDPVSFSDEESRRLHLLIQSLLKQKDDRIHIHDFRKKESENVIELTFDMTLPHELFPEKEKILQSLKKALEDLEEAKFHLIVTPDLI